MAVKKENKTDLYIEYYKAVRGQSNLAQKNQQTILNWSSAAVGGLLIFTSRLWPENKFITFMFLLIIWPSISLMFLNLWLSEVSKMIRNSNYLLMIENKIRKVYLEKDDLLGFEQWLREKQKGDDTRHILLGYISVIAIYLGIVVFAHIIANIIIMFEIKGALHDLYFIIFVITFIFDWWIINITKTRALQLKNSVSIKA